jgi:hypothetical protein
MRTQSLRVTVLFLLFASISNSAFVINAGDRQTSDIEQILKLHRELLESHIKYNAHGVLAAEPEQIIVVSGGEVRFSSKEERVSQYERYFKNVEFEEYRYLISPIVHVSDDGTLGWLIAQVKIIGTLTDGDGEKTEIDSIWAWIELYEKRDVRWIRVGEVSNVKSSNSR